ncbi:MAG: glycosyltransferase family 39 protein, partial [Planctomycetes bacterium]|nr:glycosyltransferase family 39 protein [Planctomycetota bacterium]
MSDRSTTRPTDDGRHGQSNLGGSSVHLSWPAAGIVFAAALIVRVIYLWQVESLPFFHHPTGDAASYLAWAERIGQGDFWGGEAFYQAPLYPYFLALIQWFIGPSLFALRLVQALTGASSCVFVFVAASRLVSSRAGLAAGVLLALYPPAIFYDGLIQKTSLALLLLSALLAVLAGLQARSRWSGYLGAGVLMGLLGLTRENALVLAVVVLAWLWLGPRIDVNDRARFGATNAMRRPLPHGRGSDKRDRIAHGRFRSRARNSAAFIVGIALILLPVALRNHAVGGEFTLTTVQMGPNFYIGNHDGATGRYIALQPGHESPPFERQDAKRLAQRALGRSLSDGEVSRYWLDQSFDYIREQPIDWMVLLATKWMLVWNAYEIPDVESYAIYGQWSSLLAALGTVFHFGVLCPLAVLGLILGWSYRG